MNDQEMHNNGESGAEESPLKDHAIKESVESGSDRSDSNQCNELTYENQSPTEEPDAMSRKNLKTSAS